MQFYCIRLSEAWNYNLDMYKSRFSPDRVYFEKAIDSNIGRIAIFIKNKLKISNRTKDFNIEFSKKCQESKIFALRQLKRQANT